MHFIRLYMFSQHYFIHYVWFHSILVLPLYEIDSIYHRQVSAFFMNLELVDLAGAALRMSCGSRTAGLLPCAKLNAPRLFAEVCRGISECTGRSSTG